MESINKDLFIDIDAVIASKSKRLAKFTPKFVVNWVKRIVHQDELNEILKFSNGAIDVEFNHEQKNIRIYSPKVVKTNKKRSFCSIKS